MARPKKRNFKAVSFNLDVEILEKLETYCEKTGRTKTMAIERILDLFLSDYLSREASKKDALVE